MSVPRHQTTCYHSVTAWSMSSTWVNHRYTLVTTITFYMHPVPIIQSSCYRTKTTVYLYNSANHTHWCFELIITYEASSTLFYKHLTRNNIDVFFLPALQILGPSHEVTITWLNGTFFQLWHWKWSLCFFCHVAISALKVEMFLCEIFLWYNSKLW